MKRWAGRWIIFVGVVHCAFGAVVFFDPLFGMVLDGVWNAVAGYPGRPLAFWFELCGMLMILFGATVDQLEKNRQAFPPVLRYGFAFLTVLAIVAMPMSGGWLMVPGAVGLMLKRSRVPGQRDPS